MAKIEFYEGSAKGHIAVVDDGAVPRADEWINIRGVTYRVSRVTWAVDGDLDRFRGATLRANVELVKKTDR